MSYLSWVGQKVRKITVEYQVKQGTEVDGEQFFLNPVREKKPVIFGHTPTRTITGAWKPFIQYNRIGIDTGCIYGGFLSAVVIEEGVIKEIQQVGNNSSAA